MSIFQNPEVLKPPRKNWMSNPRRFFFDFSSLLISVVCISSIRPNWNIFEFINQTEDKKTLKIMTIEIKVETFSQHKKV